MLTCNKNPVFVFVIAPLCATAIAVAILMRLPRYRAIWSVRGGLNLILDMHTGWCGKDSLLSLVNKSGTVKRDERTKNT